MTKYAIVQHSGFGYGEKENFKKGLEVREVDGALAARVLKIGGALFDDYLTARAFELSETYPEGYTGLCPAAPGRFTERLKVDGLAVYIPKRN